MYLPTPKLAYVCDDYSEFSSDAWNIQANLEINFHSHKEDVFKLFSPKPMCDLVVDPCYTDTIRIDTINIPIRVQYWEELLVVCINVFDNILIKNPTQGVVTFLYKLKTTFMNTLYNYTTSHCNRVRLNAEIYEVLNLPKFTLTEDENPELISVSTKLKEQGFFGEIKLNFIQLKSAPLLFPSELAKMHTKTAFVQEETVYSQSSNRERESILMVNLAYNRAWEQVTDVVSHYLSERMALEVLAALIRFERTDGVLTEPLVLSYENRLGSSAVIEQFKDVKAAEKYFSSISKENIEEGLMYRCGCVEEKHHLPWFTESGKYEGIYVEWISFIIANVGGIHV